MKNNKKNKELILIEKKSIFERIFNFINMIFKSNKNEKLILDEQDSIKTNINLNTELKIEKELDEQAENISDVANDTAYYKMIYNGMNNGNFSVTDLTPDEFLKVMQMQRIEYEVVTKKLKDAIDNL